MTQEKGHQPDLSQIVIFSKVVEARSFAGARSNPFTGLSVDGVSVAGKVYDPPFSTSTKVRGHIKNNIEDWVAAASKRGPEAHCGPLD